MPKLNLLPLILCLLGTFAQARIIGPPYYLSFNGKIDVGSIDVKQVPLSEDASYGQGMATKTVRRLIVGAFLGSFAGYHNAYGYEAAPESAKVLLRLDPKDISREEARASVHLIRENRASAPVNLVFKIRPTWTLQDVELKLLSVAGKPAGTVENNAEILLNESQGCEALLAEPQVRSED